MELTSYTTEITQNNVRFYFPKGRNFHTLVRLQLWEYDVNIVEGKYGQITHITNDCLF